jgi:transcriptional regulator with XRE-family HTH domain
VRGTSIRRVDDRRVGAILRALRRRRRLRQIDIALRAGVSQQTVSLIERSNLDRLSVRTIRAVFRAVGAEFNGDVRWRGPEADRVLDEAHAKLVGRVAVLLKRHGWQVILEATFSEFGERGSIDVLAWHPKFGALLVVEVKSTLVSVEELLRRLDVKVRLAPRLVVELFGARAAIVGRVVVLPEAMTERRRVGRHSAVLDVALPQRGRDVTRWLREPAGHLAGLLFLSDTYGRGVSETNGGPQRVRGSIPGGAERGQRARSGS